MGWMWWAAFAIVVAFLLAIFLALCAVQEKLPPEEEIRLIREQEAEKRRKKAERRWRNG